VIAPTGGLTVVESGPYVWAWAGDRPPEGHAPRLGALDRPGYRFTQRTVRVKANYHWVLENSLDFSHSAFVHPWTQPSWLLHKLWGLPAMTATYQATPTGLEVRSSLGDWLLFWHRFVLPDRLELVILPTSPCPLEVVVHHVPETRTFTRMEVLVAMKAWPWQRRDCRFYPDSLLVHRQDVVIVEAQQTWIDRFPDEHERHCAADAYTLLMRRVLKAACEGGWDPGDSLTPRSVAIRI